MFPFSILSKNQTIAAACSVSLKVNGDCVSEYVFVLFTGISPDEIVKVATKYHEKQEQNASKQKGSRVRNNFYCIYRNTMCMTCLSFSVSQLIQHLFCVLLFF